MRRSPFAAATLVALLIPLSACTAAVRAEASPTPSREVATTPTPTVEALVVAGGEKPPLVAGGDCAGVITPAQLAAVLGREVQSVVLRDERSWLQIANVGGVSCDWTAEGASGSLEVVPTTLIDQDALSPETEQFYFERCEEWSCGWRETSDDYWIDGTFSMTGITRQSADELGAGIAQAITSNLAGTQVEWERDTSDWWQKLDCAAIAAELASTLGEPLEGVDAGAPYHDPPMPGIPLADDAANMTLCVLSAPGGEQLALVQSSSGMAWSVPWSDAGEALFVDAEGVTAFRIDVPGYFAPVQYQLTDGTNALSLEVAETPSVAAAAVIDAVAEHVATSF